MQRHETLDVGQACQRAGLVGCKVLTLGGTGAILLQECCLDEEDVTVPRERDDAGDVRVCKRTVDT
jgi:hypothetical protein